MFIFIDESGDLGPGKGTTHFVISAVFYYENNFGAINKVIKIHNRHLWSNGWPKRLEIKATHLFNYKIQLTHSEKSNLTTNPRKCLQQVYREINKLNIKAGFLIHDPGKQGPMLRCMHKEKIYNYLSKILYTECFRFLRDTMRIYVDQRNITLVKKQKYVRLSTQRLNLAYLGYIGNELTFLFSSQKHIQPVVDITFEESKTIKGLQVVDYLAWAVRKKYEGKSYWYNLFGRIERIEKKDNFE